MSFELFLYSYLSLAYLLGFISLKLLHYSDKSIREDKAARIFLGMIFILSPLLLPIIVFVLLPSMLVSWLIFGLPPWE